jgi:hypothetical protein
MRMSNNFYTFFKTKDNSITLFNKKYNDFYHSRKGALKESLYQFIYPIKKFLKEKNSFCFFEIGFGLGYNYITTSYFLKKNNKDFCYLAVEKDRNLFNFLLDNCKIFKIKNYCSYLKNVQNNIIFEDCLNMDFKKINKKKNYLIIYHDAFSPSKNKELWTLNFFKKLKESNFDILVTFTSNPKVRVSLLLNGYFVLPTYRIGFGSGTIAFRNLNFINYFNFKPFSFRDVLLMFSNYAVPYGANLLENNFPFKVKNKKIKIIDNEFYENLKNLNNYDLKSFLKELKTLIKNFWKNKLI